MRYVWRRQWGVLIVLLVTTEAPLLAQSTSLDSSVRALSEALPDDPAEFAPSRTDRVIPLCQSVDVAAGDLASQPVRTGNERLSIIHQLCVAKTNVDGHLTRLLDLRFEIASQPEGPARRRILRSFLAINSELLHLSGRINYFLRDAIVAAGFALASEPETRERLIDQLMKDQSTIGASLMAPLLIDPPRDNPFRAQPASASTKLKVIRLLSEHGRSDVLPMLVQFLRSDQVTPELMVAGADAVIRLGLPQNVQLSQSERSENDDSSERIISALELWRKLNTLDPNRLSPSRREQRESLMNWLAIRHHKGVGPSGYFTGGFTLEPGDWLLMRNASPYNLFTDLSPGLFTHVGVVTLHRGEDGYRRLVLVDLNERQTVVRAINVEQALPTPLYYAVLRHEDPAVRKTMADVAASMIGNPMEFDLTFDTSRVVALKGQSLKGKKIETYCAGLLLLCAQETGRPREEFFPIPESSSSERCDENLDRLGMRISPDFISPTGSIFANRMRLIHLSEPMYDPGRDVEQAIYDHFGANFSRKLITSRQTLFQTLRQQLAEASKSNRMLAEALAKANNVHPDTDLASAARALAVVETLDEIAQSHRGHFREALRAVSGGPITSQIRSRLSQTEIARIERYRRHHADLVRKFENNQITRRDLSDQLVKYYSESGRRQIDAHFFATQSATRPNR